MEKVITSNSIVRIYLSNYVQDMNRNYKKKMVIIRKQNGEDLKQKILIQFWVKSNKNQQRLYIQNSFTVSLPSNHAPNVRYVFEIYVPTLCFIFLDLCRIHIILVNTVINHQKSNVRVNIQENNKSDKIKIVFWCSKRKPSSLKCIIMCLLKEDSHTVS